MTKCCIDCRHVAEEDFSYFVTAERKVRVKTTVCRAPRDSLVYGTGIPRQTDATAERHATGECGPDGLLWEPEKWGAEGKGTNILGRRMTSSTNTLHVSEYGHSIPATITPEMIEAGINARNNRDAAIAEDITKIYAAMEAVRIKKGPVT